MQCDARKTAVAVVCATIIWESADAFMDILVGLLFFIDFTLLIRMHFPQEFVCLKI